MRLTCSAGIRRNCGSFWINSTDSSSESLARPAHDDTRLLRGNAVVHGPRQSSVSVPSSCGTQPPAHTLQSHPRRLSSSRHQPCRGSDGWRRQSCVVSVPRAAGVLSGGCALHRGPCRASTYASLTRYAILASGRLVNAWLRRGFWCEWAKINRWLSPSSAIASAVEVRLRVIPVCAFDVTLWDEGSQRPSVTTGTHPPYHGPLARLNLVVQAGPAGAWSPSQIPKRSACLRSQCCTSNASARDTVPMGPQSVAPQRGRRTTSLYHTGRQQGHLQ